MKLIPAIDLKDHCVVHAGGERHLYPPLNTPLFPSAEAFDVISRLQDLGTFDTFYIADLDAIMKIGNNDELIDDITKTFPELTFWVDKGIQNEKDYQQLTQETSYVPIIPTETMQNDLPEKKSIGDYILSLDFKQQSLLGPSNILQQATQWPAIVIALSLDAIGGKGPDFEVLDIVSNLNQHSRIVAGGGIRNNDDLQLLAQRRIDTVLIANALYTGKINPRTLV